MDKTIPKLRFPKDYIPDPNILTAGRYGTKEMCEVWGSEMTFQKSLEVQAKSAEILSELYPDIVSPEIAAEILEKANLSHISKEKIRELENKTGHDIIAINTALEEILSPKAKSKVNLLKTSADTTQPAKALQLKKSLEIIADSTENLRDIIIEKSLDWMEVPHMDTTHGYDALPTVVGRPLSHYAEMLQSGLNLLKYVYENSIVGKWADVTGNHHSAKSVGVDGVKLQEKYCKALGIKWMDAPAQVPGLEFESDIVYCIARIGMTVQNIARFIAEGRKDDVNIFVYSNPDNRKGSSGMPHKDVKGGNPVDEEQAVSLANKLIGVLMTAMTNCEMPYARTLYASANSRIDLEDSFKFMDHNIRNLANTIFNIELINNDCIIRVLRNRGVVTSPQILTYLTSKVENPMPWREAHDLLGNLAKAAYDTKTHFFTVLSKEEKITSRINLQKLTELTDPLNYIGESKRIVLTIANKYYKKQTL